MLYKNTLLIIFFVTFLSAFEPQKPSVYTDQNISGWIMSEKLDGIRGIWDGKQFYSKSGKILNVPSWFIKNFPTFRLDGEFWSKRDDFENIQSTVLDKNPSKNWENITFNIFDIPDKSGDFFTRLEFGKKWFATNQNEYVKFLEQKVCADKKSLDDFLNQIIKLKGEGVIVKNPNETYNNGRSHYVLKVKKVQDMEGEVIGYNHNLKTKIFKSLKIKLENGIIFDLGGGLNKTIKNNLPKIGDVVTFKYFGFTKYGKPKFATFLRVRSDL